MMDAFRDDPAFRVYDTEGNLVHPPDSGGGSKAMASLSHAGVDLFLDDEEDAALVQFKAKRPQDSRGEYYHLEINAKASSTIQAATRDALGALEAAGWDMTANGGLLADVDEIPSLKEASMEELTALAIQRAAQKESLAFQVGSAREGLMLAKRLSNNGETAPRMVFTDNPNFATKTGLVLHPSGRDGIRYANGADRERVKETKEALRVELSEILEGNLRSRLRQALRGGEEVDRLQIIAELDVILRGNGPAGGASPAARPVVEVLDEAGAISPEIQGAIMREGRSMLMGELRAYVGEADGYAWWWILAAFLVGALFVAGIWFAWGRWGLPPLPFVG